MLFRSNHSVVSHSSRLLCPWNSPGKNTGVGSHFLVQGLFQTQGLDPDLLHCRQILYCLSHQGSGGKRICLQCRRSRFDPWVRKIPWRRKWLPTPVFLLGKSHGQRSLEVLQSVELQRVGHSCGTNITCIHKADSLCCTVETNTIF